MVNRDRRASSRVASCDAAGAILRSLVLGSDGLVARVLAERVPAASIVDGVRAGPLDAQPWAAQIARLEATIHPRPDTQGAVHPPGAGSADDDFEARVVAASA
jgi:hypothetical protein